PTDSAVLFADARLRFARHLLAELRNLVAPKDRILLVGSELASLQKPLQEQRIHTDLLPGFRDTILAKRFEIILVAGSYHYRDQLDIMTRIRACLKQEGHFLIYGEFLDDDSGIARSLLPNVSSHRRLAERLGFEFIGPRNLTGSARYSVRELLRLARERETALHKQSGMNAQDLAAGLAELELAATELANGRRCLQLFRHVFRPDNKNPYPDLRFGDMDSFAPEEVAELFQQSFDKPFDPQLWRWKYQLGKGTCVIARQGIKGRIIAHYGGAPREIDYFGNEQMAIQPCDVMVLPEERRQYGRKSLFFKVAATFLEREIGNTVGHLLGFGFPNQKAMNIALRLGLYEKTDDFIALEYPPCEAAADAALEIEAFQVADQRHRAYAEQLWQEMRNDFSGAIIGKRHSAYLEYRYFQHPAAARGEYQPLLLRRQGTVTAIVVLKETPDVRLVMDIICPVKHMPGALADLNQWLAAQASSKPLQVWLTRNWLDAIRVEGAIEREMGIEIPCNSWNPGPSSEVLYGAWWLTAGDMDFI
ncbi:MAG: GNAT family N-acetyltransferase, partial [Gammaproteobacteria bacterium]